MALRSIYPFNFRAFTAEVDDSVLAIINHFKDREPDFWRNTLRRYSFRGSDYQQGEKVRLEFNEKLFREQLSYFKDINYEEEVIYMPGFKTSATIIERALTRFSIS